MTHLPPVEQPGVPPTYVPIYVPARPVPQPKTPGVNGASIGALIGGLLGFTVIGAIGGISVGLKGLHQTKIRNQKGAPLAVTGIVLSIMWLLALGGGAVYAFTMDLPETPPVWVRADLNVGDCLSVVPPDYDMDAEKFKVSCTSLHRTEVVATWLVGYPDEAYPGQEKLEKEGDTCSIEMDRYAPSAPDELYNRLTPIFYYPTVEAWHFGDREIQCMAVVETGDPLTASIRG